ncbi:actin binding protein, putative [Entamoeba invadens IP1]|uniref:Actin binding protein, putative n=1 Tax=Entamoeba invadens IP1 TaxID=370355 RepID=A0A0A1TUE3_ENTIV|nr:actin binding protein, putative [Entamoeba invadens IP1]ELP83618.1 actin binding protein, putative [Entamoeba invadens IP1]|eukprot:XP_004182964.1 actin binding protein, putative [Entamoeba invadens IP1]
MAEEPQNPPTADTAPAVNPDEPPDFNIESDADVEPFVVQLKAFLEKHDMDVKVKLRPKKIRGSTSSVDGDGLKTGEVNIPADFKITGRDNNGKEVDHGGDKVEVKVVDPQGNEVPCEVVDNNDGTYDVKYTPVVPGDHKIEVKVNDEVVEKTPVDVLVFDELADALNCTAEGPGLNEAETKTPAPFKIITRNRIGQPLKKGGQKFDVTVNGPTIPADVQVKDNEDGTYDVEYVAKEPGKTHIDVKVDAPVKAEGEKKPEGAEGAENAAPAEQEKKLEEDGTAPAEGEKKEGEPKKEMQSIKNMPVDLDVKLNHDDADPKQCWADGPGVEGGCKTCDLAKFVIHAIKPNGEPCALDKVPFDVCVTDPEDEEIEAKIEKAEDGTYNAEYMPTKPGKYNVEVIIRNPEVPSNFEHIKGSPYTPEILAGISGKNCVVSGPGVDGGEELDDCNDAEFTIQAKDFNGDDIKEGGAEFDVKVHDPNGDDLPCEVKDNGDGTYGCKYAPEFPGDYKIDIDIKNDTHEKVGKAPYEVCVGEGVDNNKTGVDCFQFTIIAKSKRGGPVKPGHAKFAVKITHESGTEIPQENIDIKNLKEAKYRVTYKIGEHGAYTIHCTLNNRDIKGSPWVQNC